MSKLFIWPDMDRIVRSPAALRAWVSTPLFYL